MVKFAKFFVFLFFNPNWYFLGEVRIEYANFVVFFEFHIASTDETGTNIVCNVRAWTITL